MKKLENFVYNFICSIKLKKPLNRQLFYWLVFFLVTFARLVKLGYEGGNMSLFALIVWFVIISLITLFLLVNFG